MNTALIVEDDPTLRRSLLRILGRHGWQVDVAESAEQAMGFLEQKPRDVALISLRLPERSGLWLLAKIEEFPAWRATATVMTHGNATAEEIERAVELGADGFLPRPFDRDSFVNKLGRLMAMPRSLVE